MRWFLIFLAFTGSAMAQNAPPSVEMRLAECNKTAGQNLFFLGDAQETVELLRNQVAALSKKLAEKEKPPTPDAKPSPAPTH